MHVLLGSFVVHLVFSLDHLLHFLITTTQGHSDPNRGCTKLLINYSGCVVVCSLTYHRW